jgi:hypothetical protein
MGLRFVRSIELTRGLSWKLGLRGRGASLALKTALALALTLTVSTAALAQPDTEI